jgi:hypothetical protein
MIIVKSALFMSPKARLFNPSLAKVASTAPCIQVIMSGSASNDLYPTVQYFYLAAKTYKN